MSAVSPQGVLSLAVTYFGLGVIAALYYRYAAATDANADGAVTEAEFDAAIDAANPIISTLLSPAIGVGKSLIGTFMPFDAEPAP